MPNIIEITDFHAPELDPYARLTQNQLRNRLEPEKGIFIAESPKVISRALDAGYQPLSLDGAQTDHRSGGRNPDPLRGCSCLHGGSRAAGGSDGL